VQPLIKWAVGAVRGLKVEEAVPQLIELLKDADAGVRWAAAIALAKLGPGSAAAAAALRASSQDSDGEVREAATWALARTEQE